MKCSSGKCSIIKTIVFEKGRSQFELEREHRRKGFLLYFEAWGSTEGFFTGSDIIIFGFYKYSICSSMDNS